VEIRKKAPIKDVMTALPSFGSEDLAAIAATPDNFEDNIPEGLRINTELKALVDSGVIDEEMAGYYRFLIAKIIKHNPNLAKYMSISGEDLGARPAVAVKEGDRFKIILNTNFDKSLGKVDQLRIFAHEMGHIARLAFIETNGSKWRQMEALMASSRGREAIETMMLALNNGKKHDGFERDLSYYAENPEEFAAQFAGWMLLRGTFGNRKMMNLLQSRSRAAWQATNTAKNAFHYISNDILQIATVMDGMDDQTKPLILDMVEDMLGFTSTREREIKLDNPDTKLYMIQQFTDAQISESDDLTRLQELHNKEKSGRTLSIDEKTQLDSLRNAYASQHGVTADIYVEHRNAREALSVKAVKPGRTAEERSRPVHVNKSVEELTETEKKEIMITLLANVKKHAGKISISNATFGGLSRNVANKVFGTRVVSFISQGRRLLTSGANQAIYTYDNQSEAMALIMHLIGESFSITENQFKTDIGSRGLMENRNYAKQWANRVSVETGKMRAMVSKENAREILEYSYQKAMGFTVPDPTWADTKIMKQANVLAETIQANADQMRRFIHGGMETEFSRVPVHLDPKILGTKNKSTNEKVRNGYQSARMALWAGLRDEIITDFKNNDLVHSVMLYSGGLVPRIRNVYDENNKESIIRDLNRIINSPEKGALELLKQVTVRMYMKAGISQAVAERRIQNAINTGVFESVILGQKVDLLRYFHEASKEIYRIAKNKKKINDFLSELNVKLTKDQEDSLRKEIVNLLDKDIKNPPGFSWDTIHQQDSRTSLPEGLRYIVKTEGKGITSIIPGEDAGSPQNVPEALVFMQLAAMGEDPDYLLNSSIVSLSQFLSNEKLAKFLSFNTDNMLIDLERSKGFRAASEIAIHDMTGIVGYNIYDIIAMAKSTFTDDESKQALKVIETKLQIEQGMSKRGLDTKENLFTDMIIKFGPDLAKLFFGGSLNLASGLMEGFIGGFISTAYGGSTTGFIKDTFTTWLGTFPGLFANVGSTYPRSMAINMMRGLEEMAIAARISNEDTSSILYADVGKWDRVRAFYNRLHTQTFIAVASALSAQAQRIIIRNINNGNLDKLKALYNTSNISTFAQLREEMRKQGITGIGQHMAYELKQAGLFEANYLEIYKWLLANTKNRSGVMNMDEALKKIESMTDGEISKLGFTRPQMYRATEVVYKAQDNLRNTVMVNQSAFDTDTNTGALRYLASFYQQFPNLFFSQIAVRQGNKMSKRMYASLVLATTIMDLVYNMLLMVALGTLPVTALLPWHEDFLGKKNPKKFLSLILARNPFFGSTINIAAGVVALPLLEAYSTPYKGDDRSTARRVAETITNRPNVVSGAAVALGMNIYDMVDILVSSGGNMNESQTHRFIQSFMNGPGRLVPIFGSALSRMFVNQSIKQSKDVRFKPTGKNNPRVELTPVNEAINRKATSTSSITTGDVKKAMEAPPGLLGR
jgi:hypothetical protein